MTKFYHPFHLVTMSPWPLYVGIGVMGMVMGLAEMMFFSKYNLVMLSFILFIAIMFVWWRDVVREGTFEGWHTGYVIKGLVVGMILFIVSEVLFFFSFFWTFFHSSLVPTLELGGHWPPEGVEPFNPFQVPLLNTVILLSSGVSVTWAHHCFLSGEMNKAMDSLMITWGLGLYFLLLQCFEYFTASFSMSDSVFGSIFFMATGFHGFHVIVGSLFLVVVWVRVIFGHFSSKHHFGFEAAAWYWHFVDVVWLFLFSVVYWWGG
uniref:Cytochrome c oxidase subunit 3 n=1 Tax=Cyriopagopus schmidti TaxID=29017 RepID=Q6JT27_CYRSC|nr:cytochrome c oxidase subunit III [Cyriopagopus schmidti]AAP51151.1 cytochrome c oxidase subunit III [Cyriopagopus schmidti]